jgi:hypothetical protein
MFVVYNKDTTRYLMISRKGRSVEAKFDTEQAAKAGLTKAVNKGDVKREDFAIAEYSDFYTNIEKTVTVKNLMSGNDVVQPINTPRSCDPSTELYWSM